MIIGNPITVGGGGSKILMGQRNPSSEDGDNGQLYLKYVDADQPLYIRTNYTDLNITLTNYIYQTADKIRFIHRNVNTPSRSGDWPSLFGTGTTTNSKIYLQYNLWNGRRVVNIAHNGSWAGDGSVSFDTPFDYTNYYIFEMDGSAFKIYKGATLDTITDVIATATVGSASTDDTTNLILYPAKNDGKTDQEFYGLEVYRNGELIHNYIPSSVGVYDTVDEQTFATESTGCVIPPIGVTNAYLKVDDVWQKLIGSSKNDVKSAQFISDPITPITTSINVQLTVSGGYNGGAVVSVSFDGEEVFTSTASDTYNLNYNVLSSEIDGVTISLTAPTSQNGILTVTVGDHVSSVDHEGSNTSYGYDYSERFTITI